MIYFCSQKNRRARVLQSPTKLNGIDYLEVAKGSDGCGKQLLITMLKDASGLGLSLFNVRITGGTATSQVSVVSISVASKVVTVELNQSGDFSTYTLALVATQPEALAGTVSVIHGSDTVTGTGTSFTTSLVVGQQVVFASDTTQTPYQISSIASDTTLTLAASYSGATAASTTASALVANPSITDPPANIDPQLSTVQFSFKAGCPTVADCLPCNCCPPDTTPEPDINYLAKDFSGFRQVMLDRMAVIAPAWSETHESDIGIALVEALAYAADHLSYQQDAVGTEAYLGTARSRISLRRLAKLVDYQINEGSNARVWVYMNVSQDGVFIPSGTLVFPRVPGLPTVISPNTTQAATLLSSPLGFATMQDALLYQEQNQIQFYTWGDSNCCLANGATQATLAGNLTSLQPGSILVFQEMMGPNTGDPQDANPNNRWAVRLTGVRTQDYMGNPLMDPLFNQPITQISWAAEDALPFPLCISSTTDADHGSIPLTAVSVALGNIVPADHGVWQVQLLAGTVNLTAGSVTVTGTGTTFTNTLQVGQWLVFASDATQTPYQISAIANNTSLTLASPYAGATASTTAAIMEDLGQVLAAPPAPVWQTSCACTCEGTPPSPLPRYYPELANSPVTFAYPSSPNFLLPGTVALTAGSPTVTGTGTSFTTSLEAGQWLVFVLDTTGTPYQISEVTSDTSLMLTADYLGVPLPSTSALVIDTDTTVASTFLTPASSGSTRALPQIAVYDNQGEQWDVLEDLLSSTDTQRVCVLEIEHNGSAFLRFGDDQYGMAPETGMDFQVRYRVGNGSAGNIGRDSLAHILTNILPLPLTPSLQAVTAVGNPLAAAGGVDPETMDHIRQMAPFAFLTQLRAVTEDDYGTMAEQDPAISEARGTLRWTGSWYTAFVSVDTVAPSGPSTALLAATQKRLNMFRMMGVDLAVEGAVIVGLDIEMYICVDPDFFQADVETALMQLFVTGNQCTGQPGLLNPENFTFGQTIYTSPFIAAAQGVQGVTSATMTLFQRMDDPSIDGVALGYLTLGRLEIARCDNDPNRLDHGKFVLHMGGGK